MLLNDLSDDILYLVLLYLPLHVTYYLETVCQLWQYLFIRRWKRLVYLNIAPLVPNRFLNDPVRFRAKILTSEKLEMLSERCTTNKLMELKIGTKLKVSWETVHRLADQFPHLNILNLNEAIFLPHSVVLEDSTTKFGSVTNLSIDNCFNDNFGAYDSTEILETSLFQLLAKFTHLEVLSLGHNSLIYGECLFGLVTSSLTTLNLSFCRRIKEDVFSSVLTNNLKTVKHLSLYSIDRITGECLQYLPCEMDHLNISYCDSISELSMIEMVRTKVIRELRASHVNNLTERVFDQMSADFCEGLKSLQLRSYYRGHYYDNLVHIHDLSKALLKLCKLGDLVELDLEANEFVNDEIIETIANGCPKIMDLNVSKLQAITESGFWSLTKLRQLRDVNFSDNMSVTVDLIIALVHLNPLRSVIARNCGGFNPNDKRFRSKEIWPETHATVLQLY